MNIRFDNEQDWLKFKNWLQEVQDMSCKIEVSFSIPKLYNQEEIRLTARKLWYRIFNIEI